jgi:hypothetical protein
MKNSEKTRKKLGKNSELMKNSEKTWKKLGKNPEKTRKKPGKYLEYITMHKAHLKLIS